MRGRVTYVSTSSTRGSSGLIFNSKTYMEQAYGIGYDGSSASFYRRVDNGKEIGASTSRGYDSTTYTSQGATYSSCQLAIGVDTRIASFGVCGGIKIIGVGLRIQGL